ncbi:AT-hook motif nuclear-localized protein 28-like [Curcuma longa]|uniref:AT-hook motif nuclear-localized protein 28-like n=1 Tax=Curcuma longa TaxID=136217 RepID=UPI003D9F2CE8
MKDEPFQHHYLHHRQQQQQQRSLSDEVDSSRSSGETKRIKVDEPKDKERAAAEGSTIEVAKRPRGRPPGSRNKPKIPVAITCDEELSSTMCPHVLEIPSGHDVVDSLAGFSRRRNLGVSVLSGTGAVANVTLRQPPLGGAASVSTISFRGHFEILSISATFLPPAMAALSSASGASGGLISISLAGPQGQVVGGIVAGPLVTAGTVVIVAAAFAKPTFHRLPSADDASVSISVSGDMEDHEQHTYAQRRHQGPVDAVSAAAAAEPTGLSVYGSHAASDVIWAPMGRPPQPHTF